MSNRESPPESISMIANDEGQRRFPSILAGENPRADDSACPTVITIITEMEMLSLFQLYLTEKQEKIIIFSNERGRDRQHHQESPRGRYA